MKLISPSLEYVTSFESALREFAAENADGFWEYPVPLTSIPDYLIRVERYARGDGLSEGQIPSTTLWLVEGGEFLGHINIRHRLNKHLERFGGHIGYAVRPTARQRGAGSNLLRLALPEVRHLGISRALLTCSPDNIASRRIIEKCGGVLRDQIEVDGRGTLRYWIDTASQLE